MSLRLACIGPLNGVFSSINSVSFRLHCITVGHVQMSRSVQFGSVQDGICALEKSDMRSAQSPRSFPKVAFVSIIKIVSHHFAACSLYGMFYGMFTLRHVHFTACFTACSLYGMFYGMFSFILSSTATYVPVHSQG